MPSVQDSVQGLFDKARQSGAEEGTAADLRPQVPSPRTCAVCLCATYKAVHMRAVCLLECRERRHIWQRHDWVEVLLQRAAPSRSGAFSGASRTLGGAGASAAAAAPAAADAEPAAPEPVVHTITFYENGIFTVDDGERCQALSAQVLHSRISSSWRQCAAPAMVKRVGVGTFGGYPQWLPVSRSKCLGQHVHKITVSRLQV